MIIEDVTVAEKIFGPDAATLKGKTTRTGPKPVTKDLIATLKKITDEHQELILAVNTMKVNEQAFLVTVDLTVKFEAAAFMNALTADAHCEALNEALRRHNCAGFTVTEIGCDNECRTLMNPLIDT